MNKKELEVIRGVTKMFKAMSSEKNFLLLLELKKRGCLLTSDISSGLSVMPLNRRLNILKDAGLIKREFVRKKHVSQYYNSLTDFGMKLMRLWKL